MSQVDDTKERETEKKPEPLIDLAEAAAELAKLNNTSPLTKEQAEELSRRAT